MWYKLGLRHRIYILLTLMMGLALIGSSVSIWTTYRMESMVNLLIDRHMAAFHSAIALETALINQKGFVSYYFQDGDPVWLEKLGQHRQIFRQRLAEARLNAEDPELAAAVAAISRHYNTYIKIKNQVIDLYRNGNRRQGLELHLKIRPEFFKIIDLCEAYKKIHQERIRRTSNAVHRNAAHFRIAAVVMLSLVLVAGVLLALVVAFQILVPLRRLAAMARHGNEPAPSGNIVKLLSDSVYGLMADAGQKASELEKSRESLQQSEKLAMVGKLAAGVAHSVRNPLTSVKMRLFSLSRSLRLSADQQEDFDVISEEIRHVDNIVQNFLEFSRPPKMTISPVSPSTVVDQALQLLVHRLKSYGVDVRIIRHAPLAEVAGDAEQLKEVLVNLIINACEAMVDGGAITITERTERVDGEPDIAVIELDDTGPGMPEAVLERIFEPFYTTKENGTGLGLSIVARIINEHHGSITVESEPDRGSRFRIRLPIGGSSV